MTIFLMIQINSTISYQVLECLSARMCICTSGCIPERSTRRGFVKIISRRYYGRTSRFLIMLEQVKQQRGFKQTPVSIYLTNILLIRLMIIFVRFGAAGYFRESGPRCPLYRGFCYWFHSRLCSFLAFGPFSDSYSSLYRDYWCIYEQVSIQIHAVRFYHLLNFISRILVTGKPLNMWLKVVASQKKLSQLSALPRPSEPRRS